MARNDPRDAMIEYLMQQNADLLDRLQELIGQIHVHQVTSREPNVPQEPIRWHENEDEEDLRFAHDAGLIDEQELKDRLQALGFENTELSIG